MYVCLFVCILVCLFSPVSPSLSIWLSVQISVRLPDHLSEDFGNRWNDEAFFSGNTPNGIFFVKCANLFNAEKTVRLSIYLKILVTNETMKLYFEEIHLKDFFRIFFHVKGANLFKTKNTTSLSFCLKLKISVTAELFWALEDIPNVFRLFSF